MGRPYVQNVIDYIRTMSFTTHANSKLRNLNYDKFHIENVHCILTTFNADDLFELLPLLVMMVTIGSCKEWIGNMMAMRGARLR